MPFFINHTLTTNTRLAGTWKSAIREVCVFLPRRSCLIFGGHVGLNWKFTVLGSSEYSRYPSYYTIQRRPLVLRTVGKPCMCTSQCCDCSPFRLICFLHFTTLLYIVVYLGSDACLHFVNCTADPGSNPGGGEIFRTCPDRPWDPPILLYNGYRVFPSGRKRSGRDADPSPPSSA
jgi:hypothetical protein